jgi:hypothetical protein
MQIVCETLSQKHPTQKRVVGMAQVIECLPGRCAALSSNPSIIKKKKKKKSNFTKKSISIS